MSHRIEQKITDWEISDLEDEASDRASDSDINIQAYDILKKWLKDFEIPKYRVKDQGEI